MEGVQKGNIVKCKMKYKFGGRTRARIGFIKGNMYHIHRSIENGEFSYVDILDERNRRFSFYLKDGLGVCFYDYFYTIKELRQLKLEKLNELIN